MKKRQEYCIENGGACGRLKQLLLLCARFSCPATNVELAGEVTILREMEVPMIFTGRDNTPSAMDC